MDRRKYVLPIVSFATLFAHPACSDGIILPDILLQHPLKHGDVARKKTEADHHRDADAATSEGTRQERDVPRPASESEQVAPRSSADRPVAVASNGARRRAFVVGMDDYAEEKLRLFGKPANDARSIAGVLSARDAFAVELVTDADMTELTRRFDAFLASVREGDTVLFYFSGHGTELDGDNWLAATDTQSDRLNAGGRQLRLELNSHSLSLRGVMNDLKAKGVERQVLIIDACRTDLVKLARLEGPAKALPQITAGAPGQIANPPDQVFILYAASAGQTALPCLSRDLTCRDDPDPNSLFTRKLLPWLAKPDLAIDDVARGVRADVEVAASSIGHPQRPAVYNELSTLLPPLVLIASASPVPDPGTILSGGGFATTGNSDHPSTDWTPVAQDGLPGMTSGLPAGRRFTQRLLPDGTETDEGSAPRLADAASERVAVSVATREATFPAAAKADERPASIDSPATDIAARQVAQKAIFYEERSGATPGSRRGGKVVWSLADEPPAEGRPPEPAIRAVVDVPERNLTVTMTIRRNADPTLPASHVIELQFDVPNGFPGGSVANVNRPALKPDEPAKGAPLIGVVGKISDDLFIVALNNVEPALQTNLKLMGNERWIDIPIAYATGQRALLSIEKGAAGERVFRQVLDAWAADDRGFEATEPEFKFRLPDGAASGSPG